MKPISPSAISPSTQVDPNPLLTDADIAQLFRCDEETVKRHARRGILPGFKFGKFWLFRSAEIDQTVPFSHRCCKASLPSAAMSVVARGGTSGPNVNEVTSR